MTTPYSKRIHAGIVRSKLTQAEVGRRAGVKRSYVAALATGGMAKPDPVKMSKVAEVIGVDARELLALTDQLGAVQAAPPEHPASDDVVAAIDRLTAAVEAQTAMLAMQIEGQRAMMRGLAGGLAELAGAPADAPSSPSPEGALR